MPARKSPYLIQASLRRDMELNLAAYPFSIPAVRDMGQIRFHPNVTFFVGENGSGKSTVLEALAVALGFNPEGGTLNVQFSTTAAAVSPLHEAIRVARGTPKPRDAYFLRAESFYNVATYMDEVGVPERGYGGRSLHARSHGEAFMTLLLETFRGDGIYLLDEPEAALSPARQFAALRAIHHLVQGASQFVIATHSPILLAYPHARIFEFGAEGVREVAYEDTEHFALTRDFLNHHAKRIEQLLADDDDNT